MKILFLSRWYPYPPDNGSKIRIFNLIKALSAYHEVSLISFVSERLADDHLDAMRSFCRRVYVAPYQPFQPHRIKALLGFFSQRPRSVSDTYSAEIQGLIERVQREEGAFDVVIGSQIDMTIYAMTMSNIYKIFEEVEVTTLYEQYTSQTHALLRLRKGLMWWKLSRYLATVLRSFDGCTVVSEREKERVLQILPGYGPIGLVPNGVDTTYHTPDFVPPEENTLVYSGALTYDANFDAMDYFLRYIFPLIQAQIPEVKLAITGKLDGVPLDRLPNNNGVTFTGYLDDIRPQITRSWCSIIPLRKGGGTRLKILESLALGTPVISTHKGAEGLDLEPGRDILIADEPSEFATAVVRLLQNKELREHLCCNGRRAVEDRFDWGIIGAQFNTFIEQVVAKDRVPVEGYTL